MQAIIRKAEVLIEALPYIQRFREQVVVVKLGGSAMEDAQHVEGVLTDLTFMECVGMRPVVVHGGGKAISRRMQRQGLTPRFVRGLRVTCEQSVRIVEQVMNEDINPALVAGLKARGAKAEGIRGTEIIRARRIEERDPQTGDPVDLGFVGEPTEVDTAPLRRLLDANTIPVVTPLGRGTDGHTYNLNADTAAASIARALRARKLVYLSDVPGVQRRRDDPDSVFSTLRVTEVETLIREGVIDGGMLPKIQSGVEALRAGVAKVHLIDGRMPHSLLLEIFTDQGVGTEIMCDE